MKVRNSIGQTKALLKDWHSGIASVWTASRVMVPNITLDFVAGFATYCCIVALTCITAWPAQYNTTNLHSDINLALATQTPGVPPA